MTPEGAWIKTPSGYIPLKNYVDPVNRRNKVKLEKQSALNPRQGRLFSW